MTCFLPDISPRPLSHVVEHDRWGGGDFYPPTPPAHVTVRPCWLAMGLIWQRHPAREFAVTSRSAAAFAQPQCVLAGSAEHHMWQDVCISGHKALVSYRPLIWTHPRPGWHRGVERWRQFVLFSVRSSQPFFPPALKKRGLQPSFLSSESNLSPTGSEWSRAKALLLPSVSTPLSRRHYSARVGFKQVLFRQQRLECFVLILIYLRELWQHRLQVSLLWPPCVMQLTGSICAPSTLKCVKAVGNVVKLPRLMRTDCPMKREHWWHYHLSVSFRGFHGSVHCATVELFTLAIFRILFFPVNLWAVGLKVGQQGITNTYEKRVGVWRTSTVKLESNKTQKHTKKTTQKHKGVLLWVFIRITTCKLGVRPCVLPPVQDTELVSY